MEVKHLMELWKNKGQILEGITNNIFKREDVELVATARLAICARCESFDITGAGCYVPGSQPCCNYLNGGCGCSLAFAARSLTKACPKNKWAAMMTQEEAELFNEKINN